MESSASPSSGAKRSRSPGYPGIPLDAAIQRAKKLYDRESRNAAPIAVIVRHWGYSPGTSSANVSIAALKKYGLLADQGSGEKRLARLTNLALEILLNPDPTDSIREAALNPRIHRELYEKYGDSLPSDASLKHELIMTRGFTESGADDFITEFRRTLTFAQLDTGVDVANRTAPLPRLVANEGPSPSAAAEFIEPALPQAMGNKVFPIPLPGGVSVTIGGQFPITEEAWAQLLRILEAMKPGLVQTTDLES